MSRVEGRQAGLFGIGGAFLVLTLGALACVEANMRARDLPIWECPTDTPVPTDTQPPIQAQSPTSTPRPTYTPYPTPTPYFLLTDFPLGKHVNVGALRGGIGIGIWVWMDEVAVSGPYRVEGEERWVASWDVTVENASLTRPYEFYPMFQIYALEVTDERGQSLREGWGPSAHAAELAGVPPLELSEGATRLAPLQQTTLRVAVLIPAPRLERMAYVLDPLDTEDFEAMFDKRALGGNVGVWINRVDTLCTNGEITPGPPGAPGVGGPPDPAALRLARWPVDTIRITRGYGCHEFFTGQLGSDCPAEQPWFHNGLDLAAAHGAAYYDTLPGVSRIDYAGVDAGGPDCSHIAGSQPPHTGYGNYVRQTGTVAGHVVSTWGAHLSGFDVQSGDSVRPGGTLGQLGSTGCSTGTHLHFTVRVNYQTVDPLSVLP